MAIDFLMVKSVPWALTANQLPPPPLILSGLSNFRH